MNTHSVKTEANLYTDINGDTANMSNDFNLSDIPDLSGIEETRSEPLVDGWYQGTILGKREFTDNNGNDRVFESSDTVSQKGDSRNIRLQVELKRRTDGKTYNVSALINYKPAFLSTETIQAVAKRRDENKSGGAEWGDLFPAFMTLTRLGKLQKIASVRQLQRSEDGGLDLTPIYGKVAFFKLGPDNRNPQYKSVVDFREDEPKKVTVQ